MYYNNKGNPPKNNPRNLLSTNIRVFNNQNQPNSNFMYNNINNKNYILKQNKSKPAAKEKIIEGELNFSKNTKNNLYQNKQPNNIKQKKARNKPAKSPIPIPRDYKFSNYNKLFINNHQSNNSLKPKSAIQRQNHFANNNNNNKPNIGLNAFLSSNKTYNAFNIFKKNLERKQSPFQRTSINSNSNNFGQIKARHVSKSPILSKGSKFNKYKMNMLGGINNNALANSNNNNKNQKRKTPIKNKKPISNNKENIVNNHNTNNIRSKVPKLIQGELIEEASGGKININQKNINYINNNNEYNNIIPIYHSQNIKRENNNASLNIHPVNINNENVNKLNNRNELIVSNNNPQQQKINNNEPNKEKKKIKQRSQSTGITDPLQKDNKEKQNKIIKEKKEENKCIKKIKEILPYTHVGFDGEEPKENNQDNYFVYKNFMNKKNYIYMSVCDGHGVEGHFVSDFIKEILPYDMSENLQAFNILTENELEKEKIYDIIKQTFIEANEKLVNNEEINSLFSGSTCVSVIYTPEKLIIPNIGDSRAVLGRLINKETNEYKAIELSRDHKPTEKDEEKRILENDGRIQPFIEDGEFVGPQRVWIKEEEVPGLAMTRSFGDRVAATVGVVSIPEIKEYIFNPNDKFMIIASDGVWEFISSQECIDIIKEFYDRNDLKGCCEFLYQESSKRWLKEEEVIDDTTMIIVFFD
jgi:serine/threonine protein phosphatase PrpC